MSGRGLHFPTRKAVWFFHSHMFLGFTPLLKPANSGFHLQTTSQLVILEMQTGPVIATSFCRTARKPSCFTATAFVKQAEGITLCANILIFHLQEVQQKLSLKNNLLDKLSKRIDSNINRE